VEIKAEVGIDRKRFLDFFRRGGKEDPLGSSLITFSGHTQTSRMRLSESQPANLTGSLLVATPALLDPNFRRTILFLTHHAHEEGTLGIILNRPRAHLLGDLGEGNPALASVPVFEGGPVEKDHLLLARLTVTKGTACFQSFNSDGDPHGYAAGDIQDLRAFTGYAGWSAGQLESEISEKSWLTMPPSPGLLERVVTTEEGVARWRGLMRELGPWYRLLSEAPDDPGLN
jgi:putative transcriptional regulator